MTAEARAMQVAGISNGAMNGARAAYELHTPHAQEDYANVKPSSSKSNWNYSKPREPLSSVAPNRNTTNNSLQPGYPTYSRVEELGKQDGGISRSESEADSLLDLYRRNNSNSNSNVDVNNADHDIPENMYRPEDDDPEGWIHRDKLAKIENEELQAAGVNLAKARRTTSKSGRRTASRDGSTDEAKEQNPKLGREEKRQRVSSPVAEEEEEIERKNWDLRSPDEIEADSTPTNQFYTNPVLRKNGSKIPILTSSPLPIPQERVERDTPLPRKRTMSGSMSPDDGFPTNRTRPRGHSAGSQILLDDAEAFSSTPTPANGSRAVSKTGSPTKTKPSNIPNSSSPATTASRKTTPASRKSTIPTKASVSSGSTNSPSQRPGTRSGDLDRPRTAINRPEGDAPWLATMYKPDPRLPPDQQIIPTHARRQQQAQWNQEGAIPTTYDRDFSPLMVHPSGDMPASIPKQPSPPVLTPERGKDDNSWPLKPMPSERSNASGNSRPGTSGSLTGGYSTMPKVTSPPQMQMTAASPRMQSPKMGHVQIQPPSRMQEQKVEDLESGKEKEKGCGCCVIM